MVTTALMVRGGAPSNARRSLLTERRAASLRYRLAEGPDEPAAARSKITDCAAQAVSADVAKRILAILNTLPDRRSLDDFWPLLRRT
jgi:hypothetical protein